MLKKISNLIAFFVLLSLFLVVGLGLGHSFGIEMKLNGTMAGCIFDRQTAICPMIFTEHITKWQALFTVIPQKSTLLIQLLMLVSILVLAASAARQTWLLLLFNYFSKRWKLYLKHNPHITLFDHQRQLFSRGILNAKIYEPARI
jgi:hypothetical protein